MDETTTKTIAKNNRRLFPIETRKLHIWWPLVVQGLQEIVRRTRPDWIPEDVYAALRRSAATLLLGYDGDLYVGFAIVYQQDNPFNGEKLLFLWAVHTRTPWRLKPFFVDLLQDAKSKGCNTFTWQSPRAGWERLLREYNVTLKDHIFECKLGD